MQAAELIEFAKTALGEMKGFEQYWEDHRKSPQDLGIQQELLIQAPRFLTTQDGMDAEKWVVRVRKLYKSYLERKMADGSIINKKDYMIISSLGGNDESETQQMVEYINANLDKWISAVGESAAYYIIEKNDERMLNLVKDGNSKYKEYLEKIRTDYKKAYDVIKLKNTTPYQKSLDYYDALYAIYKDKNVSTYIERMKRYLDTLGEDANGSDYASAAQSLYYAAASKLRPEDHRQAIAWLEKAIPTETVIMSKVNYLVMAGDSYKELKDYAAARKYYNQAYAESLQLASMEQAQQMVQGAITYKLATLDLLEK